MTTLDRLVRLARSWKTAVRPARAGVFLRDVGHGLLEVSHNSLALLGPVVVGVACSPAAVPTCATPSRRRP